MKTFQERLRSMEVLYDIGESEHARELGRAVAHLQEKLLSFESNQVPT
jgi:hypothetical protein